MTTTIDTTPALSFTVSYALTPLDTIDVTDGPVENGFQTTEFSTATNTIIFANKTAVTIDGGNTGDSVVFDNPDPAAGIQLLSVQNLGTGSTINGGDPNGNIPVVIVPVLALSASAGIGTAARPLQTQISSLSAQTTTGGIFINNGNAAPVTLNIGTGSGGVTVAGFGASGDIVLTNNGTINSVTNNDIINGAGNVTMKALGASADVNFGGQSGPISLDGVSLVDLEAGRDINLGNGAGGGGVNAGLGSVKIVAGRNLTLDASADVVAGGSGGINASAGGNITMTTTGAFSGPPEFFTTGGPIALTTGAGGTLTLASTGANAIASNGGDIFLDADAMVISQGVNAGAGKVYLRPVTAGEAISLGAAVGGLQLSNAALNQVTGQTLNIGTPTAGSVTLAGTVAPAHVTNLTINTGGNFTASAGSTINIGAGALIIGFDENNLGATADLSGAAITAGVQVFGGAGNDIFITGAGSERINGGGGSDTAVFSGTRAQYTINTAPSGLTTVTKGGVTDTLSGIGSLRFSDQTIPTPPPPSTPAGTTADLILQETTGATAGQLEVYDLGSNSIVAGYALGAIGMNWQTLGLGSFAGNPNEADMLVRDSASGNISYFDIQNSQIAGAGSMGNVGVNWQVLGVGDFSGNANETDMLMRNSTNDAIDYFDIQHNQFVSVGSVATIGTEWQTLGVGDFSGNSGEADLLMRDTNNGAIDYVDIQHNQIVGAGAMGSIGANWQVLGFGDFSGNANETDMIMRDSNTGNLNYFDIQHNQIVSAGAMGSIGVNWQPVGFADVSGMPGEADMILRDSNTGNFEYFDIQHNQIVSAGLLGSIGPEWHTLGVGSPLVPGNQLI